MPGDRVGEQLPERAVVGRIADRVEVAALQADPVTVADQVIEPVGGVGAQPALAEVLIDRVEPALVRLGRATRSALPIGGTERSLFEGSRVPRRVSDLLVLGVRPAHLFDAAHGQLLLRARRGVRVVCGGVRRLV